MRLSPKRYQQRELEDHLRRLAASDPLTGRPTIAASWMCSIGRSSVGKRTSREFALLFVPGRIRLINGPPRTFDREPKRLPIWRMFCALVARHDTPARFGGDEFALVLPETPQRRPGTGWHDVCESCCQ